MPCTDSYSFLSRLREPMQLVQSSVVGVIRFDAGLSATDEPAACDDSCLEQTLALFARGSRLADRGRRRLPWLVAQPRVRSRFTTEECCGTLPANLTRLRLELD